MALLILVLLFQLEERRMMTQYSTSDRCVCPCMCALTDPQSTAGTAAHSTSLLKKEDKHQVTPTIQLGIREAP